MEKIKRGDPVVSCRLPKGFKKILDSNAQGRELTKSELIRELIINYLNG